MRTPRAVGLGVFVLALLLGGGSAAWMALDGRWEPAFRFAVVTGLMLVVRAGRTPAAFAGPFAAFLLLATWASVQHWYREIPQFDVLVHVVTPGSLATVSYFVLVQASVLPSVRASARGLREWAPVVWVTTVGVTAAVLWEFYEWVVEQWHPQGMIVGYDDTILDLLAGMLGSLVGGALVLWWGRRYELAEGGRPGSR